MMWKKTMAVLVMLFAIAVLSLPSNNTAKAQTRWCTTCGHNCWNEANTGENNEAYWRCRDGGNSQSYCDKAVTESYYNSCVSVVCNYGGGCTVPLIY
jgi:flavoprotein